MHTNEFINNVSETITMLSHVIAFHVDPKYNGDEIKREKFIRDYFKLAKSYMKRATEQFKDKK